MGKLLADHTGYRCVLEYLNGLSRRCWRGENKCNGEAWHLGLLTWKAVYHPEDFSRKLAKAGLSSIDFVRQPLKNAGKK